MYLNRGGNMPEFYLPGELLVREKIIKKWKDLIFRPKI
jgi:hypothetical protein